MYQLDHILVALDLTDMDSFLIRYSNFLVEKFDPKSITFMHVMNKYDIPKEVLSSLEMDESLADLVKEEIQEKVDEDFKYQDKISTTVVAEEGVPTENIIQYTIDKKISLTLMGKKIGYKGRGSIVRRVLNISPSSVLLVSETTRQAIEHVMVRMDFSKISEMALKMALKVKDYTGAEVSCHHVYKLPLKYFGQVTIDNSSKIKQHMERHGTREYQKFMKRLKLDPGSIECEFSLDAENDEAHEHYKKALQNGADMIMIGSRVKSELTDVILDSTSEKLAGVEKNIPVFVVKDRKRSLGFLDKIFD